MKRTILNLIVTVIAMNTFGQTTVKTVLTSYESAMVENIQKLDTATGNTLVILANNFERIGHAEKIKWEPFYYAAYCYTVMAFTTSDKSQIDVFADQADKILANAASLSKNNSEITIVSAMINSCRILVDPVSRFQVKGREVAMQIEKAKVENPDNPRIYLQEARMKLRTPEAFGGGKQVAKISIEKSLELFQNFKAEGKISPSWGYDQAQSLHKVILNN